MVKNLILQPASDLIIEIMTMVHGTHLHRIKESGFSIKTRLKDRQEGVYIWLLTEQQRDPDVWLPLTLRDMIALRSSAALINYSLLLLSISDDV